MTDHQMLALHLRVRLRDSGYQAHEITPELVWQCLDDSRPKNRHIVQLADKLYGADDSMTLKQTNALIRSIRKEWF
jgi:hypothetical protein